MAAGTFTIQEVRKVGSTVIGGPRAGDAGERFEWTSDRTPPDPTLGGARATPVNVWELSGKLRRERTDYPGAKTPSVQVLGPVHEPFTLNGRWDDRYNFPGYAVKEMRRFEALCRRGNLCRFQFQGQVFEGLITDWRFPYRREWDIRYEFTVDAHDRPDETDLNRAPFTAQSPIQLYSDAQLVHDALASIEPPTSGLVPDVGDDAASALDTLSDALDGLGATLDSFDTDGLDFRVVDPFRRIATQFRSVAGRAFDLSLVLFAVRSDTEMAVRTAMSVLDFEEWSRSVRFYGRVLMGHGTRAAAETEERSDGSAVRVYRPHEGESLYSISRRFYGTPHAWRLIADRNRLSTMTLGGDELLIIPERGEG